ncbi:MAG TPA: alpha/beta hydrolase [Syntrophomonadaceae bacterium]|jgi:monoterpene epsilon-lactone hydrolase|nr:alpha/beta hydrolase [Syntrophomonadaceae bacterium]HRX21683.1 alpha/beta hydrolase [Syntrophomonadaceae bacterium]
MSVKGKMMHVMLRNRHLMKGKLKREVIDKNSSIEQLRLETDQAAARIVDMPEGINFVEADYDKCYAEWVIADDADEDKAVLYFHGGGFIMGNARSHRAIVAGFMKRLGAKALVFDYHLAPENPAPAAVNDSAAIYSWMLKQGYKPENIAFSGDSAGAGIAVGTLLKLKDENIPLPAACALFSPCVDMTMSGESHRTRAKADPCTPPGSTETYLAYYVGDGDPEHPYASPLFGDLTGLPPMIIQVGNDEVLRDDSVYLATRAKKAGVEVNIKVWKGMFHCFPLLAPMFPEATLALEEVCQFVREKLKMHTS